MLLDGNCAAEDHRDHLVAQIAVVGCSVGLQQDLGAAGRDEGAVELPVVALPDLRVGCIARKEAALQRSELVVRRDHAGFPV